MSTPNRAEINRANSLHSTGPKTEAGKQRSSMNAMKHGFTGQLVVMPDEDLELYQHHLKSFHDEYHPQGATEENLVQALADVSWRLNRVAALESNLLSISYTPRDLVDCLFAQAKALANLSMHSQRLSRQFERTVVMLRDLQKTRRAHSETHHQSKDGFVFSPQEIATAQRPRRVTEPPCLSMRTDAKEPQYRKLQ
jgi:hypothetical protein